MTVGRIPVRVRVPISAMPKTVKAKSSTSSHRQDPTEATVKRGKGKDSHLYTDDNPATTLHGTGFKDLATAQKTLSLVSQRSLTYQFQTINTMYYRASGHAHKTPGMEAAMEVFREWLDKYPEAKDNLRANQGFKPVLKKEAVEKWLPRIREELSEDDRRFAEVYCNLKKGARLANQLVEQGKPAGHDWECERYLALDRLVPEGKETEGGWESQQLWTTNKQPTAEHLRLIAWAWTPAKASKV